VQNITPTANHRGSRDPPDLPVEIVGPCDAKYLGPLRVPLSAIGFSAARGFCATTTP
jgi:hypothetical protein